MRDRPEVIKSTVQDLLAVERSIAELLDTVRPVARAIPTASHYLAQLAETVEHQRDTVAAHLQTLPGQHMPSARMITMRWSADAGDGSITRALQRVHSALTYATTSYAVGFEVALRLYDPALRKIAPEHLKTYADQTSRLERLLVGLVAWELRQEGLECHCICPMCSIGACGCVAVGTATLVEARSQPAAGADATTGFPLQAPRPHSQLAQAGVQEGDWLIAVDGKPVSRISEIQAAIRNHQVGEQVHLTVRHDSGDPRDIVVKHVSDYPRA